MPYCVQCGTPARQTDTFCAKCGARQAVSSSPASDPLAGVTPRTAAILCYVPLVGWLASVIVLASNRFRLDRATRFHAFQGLYLFVAWLIIHLFVAPFYGHFPGAFPLRHIIPGLLRLSVFAAWILMLVKTSQNEQYHLPVIGELAERSLAEQS